MMLTIFFFSRQRSGVVGLDVSQWRGSSIFSFDGANCSSPTAPLLIDPNTHTGHQLYPVSSSHSHTHTHTDSAHGLLWYDSVAEFNLQTFCAPWNWCESPYQIPWWLTEWSQSKIPQHSPIKLCLSTLILGLVLITPLPCREHQPEVQPIPDHGSPSTLTPVEWSGVAFGSITVKKVPLANLNTLLSIIH